MRLLTFSFLKTCKFKHFYNTIPKRCRSDVQPVLAEDKIKGDPSLISVHPTWPEEEHAELRMEALRDMAVLPGFVSEQEEAALLAELEPVLKRMRYEYDHWDDAIHGFRETERSSWQQPSNEAVFSRVRSLAFSSPEAGAPLPHVHVLDLAPAGVIKPHVDAVRFCGALIAGLCLGSSAVMRLVHQQHPHLAFDALLPQRCLYIMKLEPARTSCELVGAGPQLTPVCGEHSEWRGERLVKRRRVALILRSTPPPAKDP